VALEPTDLLERLVATVPAAIVACDLRGYVQVFSPGAERILGHRAPRGRERLHVSELYHRVDDARSVMAQLKAAAGAHVGPLEMLVRARNGEVIPTRLLASIVHDLGGQPVATVGVFEDRREANNLHRRLEEVTDQVVQSERRTSALQLASQAAHELSQPLMAAMGNIELLMLSPGLGPEVSSRLERAYAQLERMRRTVSDFTKIAAPPTSAATGTDGSRR
jgi:PAS domain S-box-containing protein